MEINGVFPVAQIPAQTITEGWEVTSADGFCCCAFLLAFLEQIPVILVVERLYSENLLVSEHQQADKSTASHSQLHLKSLYDEYCSCETPASC